MDRDKSVITDGAAAAAFLSAGIGSVVLGVLTLLKANSVAAKGLLTFYVPTGPLSGQTTLTIAVWLISWFILNRRWKNQQVNFNRIFVIALILVAVGLLATFPPLFEAFSEFEE